MARARDRLRTPELALDVPLLRTLGDETRLAILRHLCTPGAGVMTPVAARDIAAAIKKTPATVSHHLGMLLEAGLVSVKQRGKERYYTLDLAALRRETTRMQDQVTIVVRATERAAAALQTLPAPQIGSPVRSDETAPSSEPVPS